MDASWLIAAILLGFVVVFGIAIGVILDKLDEISRKLSKLDKD